ncbi:MAG TPA: electron transport complex subunit RsxC, partial [Candidatus Omnitrophica bacterium]|nr:electron transport complex subunit RsxC [Candidatus Omnitrophota bacterium]
MGRKYTFPGGIHPQYYKELTNSIPIKRARVPAKVSIPLLQHIGAPCAPQVKAADTVKAGTLLGASDKYVSAYVHSSVSGKVVSVGPSPHPALGSAVSVTVESDGRDDNTQEEKTDAEVESLTPDDIKGIVRAGGIVGLGGAAFPTHVKLNPPSGKKISTFILNGSECEPYLSCDHRLMLERPKDIMKGALLIMKAVGAGEGYIAIEDNKPDAIKAMKAALNEAQCTMCDVRVVVLRTKYPQGGEKQLIKAILNSEVPPGALPLDKGCLVDNVGTALAIYEAVKYKKPLYERAVTVVGDAISKPANLLVRIGTPVSALIAECGGLKKDLGKIIFGGPMMGFCECTDQAPVIKGTSGIILISRQKTKIE